MIPFELETLPLRNINWSRLVPLIGKANASLARYDGILQGIVNTDVLLSPLTTQEAVLSSRIEGTQATMEEVLEFEASPGRKTEKLEDIKEVINYRKALNSAVKTLRKRPISLNMILGIHSDLLEGVRGQFKARGKLRNKQNWIGKPGTPIEKATFVPPPPDKVLKLMANLEDYVHFEEKDRLVQLAVVHGQFELIHPFLDGNGRVGRILVPIYLYEKELLSSPMFYLSSYLESSRDLYYERLQGISRNSEWTEWISFFLEAVAAQAEYNSSKAKSILDLYEQMKSTISRLTRSQFSIQALDALFDKPIFTTTDFIRKSGIPKPSASRILSTLQKDRLLDILVEGRGRRAAILVFSSLISLVRD
ncbi:MAG: Fic/DOC family N-terminal domain-containing protein [Candidatus Glassbacteria bacterium]